MEGGIITDREVEIVLIVMQSGNGYRKPTKLIKILIIKIVKPVI